MILFGWLILSVFLEIFGRIDLVFPVRFGFLVLPYVVFSLVGIWYFSSGKRYKKTRLVVILSLTVLSIFWFMVFTEGIIDFCFPK